MLDIIRNIFESVKKNRELIVYFIIQLFIRNSTPWFNMKNLIKALSYSCKKSWTFIRIVGIETMSALNQSSKVAKEMAQASTLSLLVLVALIQLKLHYSGIIKMNTNKAIALSLIIFAFGLISAMSKMEFTKIEAENRSE
jgi:hypothetical protein